jgi:hypothetical protein
MIAKCAAIIGLIALSPGAASAQVLRCEVRQKFVCEEAGCRIISANTWAFVDPQKKTYARCDVRGCDTYEARIYQSGAFLNIEVPGRSSMAKIATQDASLANLKAYSFHEVVSQMHTILVSYGLCKPP